jgi:hypothetical protein
MDTVPKVTMKRLSPLFRLCSLIFPLVMSPLVAADDSAEDMKQAAVQFLQALDDDRKAKAVYALTDDERLNWHFIPKERNGLALKDMDDAQRALAHALISTGLSGDGYRKALTIMSLEKVLWELENKSPRRDAGNYFITIFGDPAADGAWGWRLEGHHLAANFTVDGGKTVSSASPIFMATNPGEVREGPRTGLRVLKDEEEMARALLKSLDEEQAKKAVFSDKAPEDILSAASRKAAALEPMGLGYKDLTADQQKALVNLVKLYLSRQPVEIAEREWKRIETSGMESLHFAWAGGRDAGQGHYYRVQGAHFLMEYANTQNDANHVHSVWRDFDGDFGMDVLREHYEKLPH